MVQIKAPCREYSYVYVLCTLCYVIYECVMCLLKKVKSVFVKFCVPSSLLHIFRSNKWYQSLEGSKERRVRSMLWKFKQRFMEATCIRRSTTCRHRSWKLKMKNFQGYFCKICRFNNNVHFVRFCSDFLEEVDQGPV